MVSIIRKRSQSVSVGMCLSVRVSRKRRQASIPSLCGMLVYSDETSRVTPYSLALGGKMRDPGNEVVSLFLSGFRLL